MGYTVSHIAEIITTKVATEPSSIVIEHLLLDSRKIIQPSSSLFFALTSVRRNGHHFIPDLYKKGLRAFVVSEPQKQQHFLGAVFILVDETLAALQQLVIYHRSRFNIPVIGISGSNGKTMQKEWLYQLLQPDYTIVRSPKSYNSQIGVPLSVWQMNEQHNLGIFEAGISTTAEMDSLQKVIQPSIGLLTNIGEAHSDGFADSEEKVYEKMKLFKNCDVLIGREKDFETQHGLTHFFLGKLLTWGLSSQSFFFVKLIDKKNEQTQIIIQCREEEIRFNIPFIDDASIENAISCCCVLLFLKTDKATIAKRMEGLYAVNMRLELKKGINHCSIINDSYSADFSSFQIALNFLTLQSGATKKTVILSDFLHSAFADEQLYKSIFEQLSKHAVDRLIAIGSKISEYAFLAKDLELVTYESTEVFIQQFRSTSFKDEAILIKGARVFEFEKIVRLLEQKVHQTVLDINLNSIVHNLKEYQKLLKPATKVMAMVKAFAYGSGAAEIAGILQYHKIDYLGVAYADEGVELRKAGIHTAIMVMNPDESSFDAIVENNLEPEIYSFELLAAFEMFLKKSGYASYPIHIEIETGMNRLGFAETSIEELAEKIQQANCFSVQSVFSHFAASEEPAQDDFTNQQFEKFQLAATKLEKGIGYSFIRHIANSAAIIRHPNMQLDMVRLGIGLYGVDTAASQKIQLQTAATLKSTIAQIKYLKAEESVSYNRRAIVKNDTVIATIRLGYADGYPRRLGSGQAYMLVNGCKAPIIGSICMDMLMIDITSVPNVQEGDEVIVFGKDLTVQQLANWAQTIPYEIMTGISQRVKRVYFEE